MRSHFFETLAITSSEDTKNFVMLVTDSNQKEIDLSQ